MVEFEPQKLDIVFTNKANILHFILQHPSPSMKNVLKKYDIAHFL